MSGTWMVTESVMMSVTGLGLLMANMSVTASGSL
jgi:hypothetical protein